MLLVASSGRCRGRSGADCRGGCRRFGDCVAPPGLTPHRGASRGRAHRAGARRKGRGAQEVARRRPRGPG